MKIPFVDLKAQYENIKDEIGAAVSEVLESTQFIGGEKLARFEENFARYVDAKYAVGASSGTSAIHLALAALDIGEGDEVITAANTFIATTEAITMAGAKPVLVDVLDHSLNIDPEKVEAAVTPRTRAIMPVHLYGQAADMGAVKDIASRHNLHVVADAAQAHGARYKGNRKGIQGEITCFSFYPGKNLGAYGDAGAVVTDDGDLAKKMKALADHGSFKKYYHSFEGFNYRLDTMQAVILDVKLRHIDRWTEARRSRAARYDDAFAGGPVSPVKETPGNYHVYHLYVVRSPKRDELLAELGKRGIAAGIHYPIPLHLQEAYTRMGLGEGSFPVTEKAAKEIVSLPMYAELTDQQVDAVVSAVKEIHGASARHRGAGQKKSGGGKPPPPFRLSSTG
jgi:dTDP-4-amino-4,6-dideoxygalactose transaminase